MNLAQLRVAVRDKLSAGAGQNTTLPQDAFWEDAEVNFAINEANQYLVQQVRKARRDFFATILNSTDPTQSIMGYSYAASSLQMQQGVGEYTLPPDVVRILSISDLRTPRRIRFKYGRLGDSTFKAVLNVEPQIGVSEGQLFYSIIGSRTLMIRPEPTEAFDIKLIYEQRYPPLSDYSIGTVAATNGSQILTFTGADLANFFSIGDEILIGGASVAPTIDPLIQDYVIQSIDVGGNMVTLEQPYRGGNVTGASYIRSKVSPLPAQHHWALVTGGVIKCFEKGTNPYPVSVTMFKEDFARQLSDLLDDVEDRQLTDPEHVEAYGEQDYELF